ncbi:MAG: pseudouridine synthase [Lachnospiraceae bacterium]
MIRLDKYLADMGIGTRTEVKKEIRKGTITIDGTVVKIPEVKVEPGKQQIAYQGEEIEYASLEYYMLNKPTGVISASSDRKQKTVLDLIDTKKRKDLFPVGRLDKDTEGLLLITNDGDLAHRLLSPKKHVNKVYVAKVCGLVTQHDIDLFKEGIDIGEEQNTKPAILEILEAAEVSTIQLTIQEGKFHQVKRMFQAVDKEVLYLKRLSMGSLVLDETLQPGAYRSLSKEELKKLS